MRLLILLFLFSLAACNKSPGGDSVKIISGNVTSTALFTVNNQEVKNEVLNLGEYTLNSSPLTLTVRIYNDTQYPYTEMDLLISSNDPDQASTINFLSDQEGAITFPGAGGTCTKTLGSKQSCLIILTWAPRDERPYQEKLTLQFKNYIEQQSLEANLQLLAGTPASLTFTNDQTQYTFGHLTGTAQNPVVERADGETFIQELEVMNTGGLNARNLLITQAEICASSETNVCPSGMNGAFTLQNSCPSSLAPKETCKVTVTFKPKNQDPSSGIVPTDIQEINYRSTVSFAYLKDPLNGAGTLNGHFRSISTNIEARLKVSLTALSFDDPVISGNRDVRTFRVNNVGFREGEIKSFTFKNGIGANIANCYPDPASNILQCQDGTGSPLTLAAFPFFMKDRNSCLAPLPLTGTLIEVGAGCIFDLYFQPSTTFLADMTFENIKVEVNYDSRWRGGPKLLGQKILDLSAKSLAAARIELVKFNFLGNDIPILGTNPSFVDMGRLALQSPNYYKKKIIIITYKNMGSVPANNISFKDLAGKTIPVGGTPVSLGAKAPYYYSSTMANESNCSYIASGDLCSMTMEFAPIGMADSLEEDANMFDGTTLDGKKIKGIQVNYKSGASFSDLNFTDTFDISTVTSNSQIHAQLIRKGLLMELGDSSLNISTTGPQPSGGDTIISYLYLQNIGTGDIPYIRYTNPPTSTNLSIVSILPTPDPESLGANYDCLNIADIDLTGTVPTTATPDERVGNFMPLPKDKTCVYTLKAHTSPLGRAKNAFTCTNSIASPTKLIEGTRFFSRQHEGGNSGEDLWEYCDDASDSIFLNNISFNYYDGDATDPSLPMGSFYGKSQNLRPFSFQFWQAPASKLLPFNFEPVLTATLYRPSFTYPYLSPTQSAGTVPERWFYGSNIMYFFQLNDPEQTSPFVQSNLSRNFVQTLTSFGDRTNFDHILFLGSLPQGSPTIKFTPGLMSFGNKRSVIRELDVLADSAFTQISTPILPLFVLPNGTVSPFEFQFSPSIPGEHRIEIRYQYENGRHAAPVIYQSSQTPSDYASVGKIIQEGSLLVVAHVQATGTYPFLAMDVQDYDVVQNPGFAPIETVLPPVSTSLSWNNNTPASYLTFDSIKLTTAPTIQDVYAKKKIILKNPTIYPLSNLKMMFRQTATAPATKVLPNSFKVKTAESTCVSEMTIAPGANCVLTYLYQPGSSDITDNFIMSFSYDMGNNQPIIQNVGISLMPRSPGLLVAQGKTTESINYKITPTSSITTRFSYPLNFGTVNLNAVPSKYSFNAVSGTYQKLQFINTQTTKASLLLSYQKYVTDNSLRGYSPANPAPTSLTPLATEYINISGTTEKFVTILRTTYDGSQEKLLVEASKGCLFGDDEIDGAIPPHQKGFNSSTVTPCYVSVKFTATFHWLLRTIAPSNGDHMRDTAAELWYYSVNRSSTASVWVHVRGTINPDISLASGSYDDVEAMDNRTISFRVPDIAPTNAAVGDVVGLRVLMSANATALNNPYSTTHTYFDIYPYTPGAENYAEFLTGLGNGQFFYFRVLAIRKDIRFTDTAPKRFIGLRPNEYLSYTSNNTTPLKVLVPPLNHAYFHQEKLVIDKNLHDGVTYANYSTASNKCTNRTKMSLKDPGSLYYSYALINIDAWELLLDHPYATNYNNMTQTSHWVSDPQVSVDSMCGGLPGFLPGQASQILSSSGVFYLRNSSNYSSLVNQVVGGVPGTSYSNYMSYVYGTTSFASSRCMVRLP